MRKTFDRRVVPDSVLDFVRACQKLIPCHLGGGAALAGAYPGHRMTGDIDLFVHDAEAMRALVGLLPEAAVDAGVGVSLLRDAGHLVCARDRVAQRCWHRPKRDGLDSHPFSDTPLAHHARASRRRRFGGFDRGRPAGGPPASIALAPLAAEELEVLP